MPCAPAHASPLPLNQGVSFFVKQNPQTPRSFAESGLEFSPSRRDSRGIASALCLHAQTQPEVAVGHVPVPPFLSRGDQTVLHCFFGICYKIGARAGALSVSSRGAPLFWKVLLSPCINSSCPPALQEKVLPHADAPQHRTSAGAWGRRRFKLQHPCFHALSGASEGHSLGQLPRSEQGRVEGEPAGKGLPACRD